MFANVTTNRRELALILQEHIIVDCDHPSLFIRNSSGELVDV